MNKLNKKSKRRTKRKYTKKKLTTLIYFYMDDCIYCKEFKKNKWPKIERMKHVKTQIINGPKNPLLANKYKIKTYPTLVRLDNGKYKIFKGKRNMKNLIKFLK